MALPAGNNPVRASERKIQLKTSLEVKVIEGHGEWRAPYSEFTVPDSVQIVVYTGSGVGLDDADGVTIGQGGNLSARLRTAYDAGNGEYDTTQGGAVRENTSGTKVYYGGERCPNYTLLAYNEPGYPVITAPQVGSLSVPQGTTRTLRDFAQERSSEGVQLRWAACTVIR